MKIRYNCLPCIVNQAIKVAEQTGLENKELLMREVFGFLEHMDYQLTTPEVIGEIFEMIKRHTGNEDPYKETRDYYNRLFIQILPEYRMKINQAEDPFNMAVLYAIIGNIIDFNPIHNTMLDDVMNQISLLSNLMLEIDDTRSLKEKIAQSKSLLYLGDNCGEICMDKLLLAEIRKLNPEIQIWFAVRGKPIVNDSIEEDAYFVGIDQYAQVLNNGDGSMGTVLSRVSDDFMEKYNQVDIIIAKGQANYECLSEEKKEIYFLLMTKCSLIANDIGVPEKKMICMKTKGELKNETIDDASVCERE